MKGNFNSTILNYYQNVKPEAYANKKLNHSTKKELDYLYNRFIKAFDNEISLNELMVDLQSYDIDVPYEYMELKHYFVVTFKKYASKEYGIDDLEKYICSHKLFRESYEYFDNLRKDKITVREYRDYMEKLKIHPNTMKCFVLGYANTHGIKIDNMTIETLPAMKVLDFIAKATQNEDINNLSDVTLNNIYQVLYDYAGFVNGDYNKSRGYLSRLRKKSNTLAKYFTQYGDEKVMAKLFKVIITKVMEITTNKYLIRKKEIAMQNKNNKVNEALEVVESYLNNDMCLTDFVTSKQMSVKEFDNCRKIVAKEKPEVYQEHIHPLDIDDDKTSKIMDVVNRLVYDLDEINILDFYEIAAPVNLSLDNFYEIVMIDSWKRQTKIEVARFVNNNKVTHKDDEIIKKIMNLNISMGDRKITQSDKEEIINYLKSINAPISHKIFMIALSRYVNGTLIEKGKVMEKIDL